MSLHILITEFLTLKYIKLVYVFTCAFSASNTPCVLFYFYFFFILFTGIHYFSSSFLAHVPVMISLESMENQSAFTFTPTPVCYKVC